MDSQSSQLGSSETVNCSLIKDSTADRLANRYCAGLCVHASFKMESCNRFPIGSQPSSFTSSILAYRFKTKDTQQFVFAGDVSSDIPVSYYIQNSSILFWIGSKKSIKAKS